MTYWEEMNAVIETDDPEAITRFIRADPSRLNGDKDRDPCLHEAAECGKLKAVQCLCELGADINLRGRILEWSPLEVAASEGHVEIVQYLLQRGAQMDTSRPNRNPLFHAISKNHSDVAASLLLGGLNPHVTYRTPGGALRNALSYAKDCRRTEVVDLLVAAGCRMPEEGVDYPVNEAQIEAIKAEAAAEADDWDGDEGDHVSAASEEEQIVEYVSNRFGPADELALREIVPILDDVSVAIHVIPATERHPFTTIFTTGMSSRAMKVPSGQEAFQFGELTMHFPPTWPLPRDADPNDTASLWPIEVLHQLAYLPHVNHSWYGPYHTAALADPPRPFGPNTQQSCALLIADKVQPLVLASGKTIKFFTVYPLYAEELEVALKTSIDELLNRLQAHKVTPIIDVNRKNTGIKN